MPPSTSKPNPPFDRQSIDCAYRSAAAYTIARPCRQPRDGRPCNRRKPNDHRDARRGSRQARQEVQDVRMPLVHEASNRKNDEDANHSAHKTNHRPGQCTFDVARVPQHRECRRQTPRQRTRSPTGRWLVRATGAPLAGNHAASANLVAKEGRSPQAPRARYSDLPGHAGRWSWWCSAKASPETCTTN